MNFSVLEPVLGRQRCRNWTPLLTQQLRLRHVYQIMAYNVKSQGTGRFYFTLHLTTMCSPFYTSEKKDSLNPKWSELDSRNLAYPSSSAFVLRIWEATDSDMDVIITTWGINLSGLVYLGTKLPEIQPHYFNENSVILYLRGGFFTSQDALRKDLQRPLEFIDNLNIISNEFETKIYRNTVIKTTKVEVKTSYTVNKLQKLHSLQIAIKNKSLDVQATADKITAKCGLCDPNILDDKTTTSDNNSPVHRPSSQLLTMNTLNKLLQIKVTKAQKQQIVKVKRQIEIARFRTKLLIQERDKKTTQVRLLQQKFTALVDENEEKGSFLMESYHKLSRDSDKLKEWRKEQMQVKEVLHQINGQLYHRRRQLVSQLLTIYPITKGASNKHFINGVHLPDSEMLSDSSDDDLAVALGYVSHLLLMCASFLQVPLRYPITYFGSRSYISDHITVALAERDRDFPLYGKGKDRMQFNYGVYLLNKNIAQLRWICGQHTPDLRATLPNLLSLLQGRDGRDSFRDAAASSKVSHHSGSLYDLTNLKKSLEFLNHFDKASNVSDLIFDAIRQECRVERSHSPGRKTRKTTFNKNSEPRPGLSEILAVPEAFMNKQISQTEFKNYIEIERFKQLDKCEEDSKQLPNACCDTENIEQGTDILHSSMNLVDGKSTFEIKEEPTLHTQSHDDGSDKLLKQNRRISRSVDSITEEVHTSLELGSDPLLNLSAETLQNFTSENLNLEVNPGNLDDSQQEFLQKWLDSGPALVCSEENLYPEEILGTTVSIAGSRPLTMRTDALLNTTSFNLIKPK